MANSRIAVTPGPLLVLALVLIFGGPMSCTTSNTGLQGNGQAIPGVPPWKGNQQQICYESLPPVISLRTLAIGCESTVDCCVGCPAIEAPWNFGLDAELELEIEGDFASSVALTFDNFDEQALSALDLSSGTQNGNKVTVLPGLETIDVPDTQQGAIIITPEINVKSDLYQAAQNGDPLSDLGPMSRNLEIAIRSYPQGETETTYGKFIYQLELVPCGVQDIGVAQYRDKIEFTHTLEIVSALALFDGRTDFGCLNDATIRGEGSIITGNILSPQFCENELIVLSREHAPLIQKPQIWTDSPDQTHKIDWRVMPDAVSLPINVLIATTGTVDSVTEQLVKDQWDEASFIYKENYNNIEITAASEPNPQTITDINKISEITEIAKDANADNDHPNCTQMESGEYLSLIKDEPATSLFNTDALNIYFVSEPEGLTGLHIPECNDNSSRIIFIGPNPNPATLAHEIGHALSLSHVGRRAYSSCEEGNDCLIQAYDDNHDDILDFDSENVMFIQFTGRKHLTEGQLFRAFVNETSILNSGGYRLTGETRNCEDRKISVECPWLGLDPADAE